MAANSGWPWPNRKLVRKCFVFVFCGEVARSYLSASRYEHVDVQTMIYSCCHAGMQVIAPLHCRPNAKARLLHNRKGGSADEGGPGKISSVRAFLRRVDRLSQPRLCRNRGLLILIVLFGGCDDLHPHGGRFSVRAPFVLLLPRARCRRARTVVVVCTRNMNYCKARTYVPGGGGVKGNTCDHSFCPEGPRGYVIPPLLREGGELNVEVVCFLFRHTHRSSFGSGQHMDLMLPMRLYLPRLPHRGVHDALTRSLMTPRSFKCMLVRVMLLAGLLYPYCVQPSCKLRLQYYRRVGVVLVGY